MTKIYKKRPGLAIFLKKTDESAPDPLVQQVIKSTTVQK